MTATSAFGRLFTGLVEAASALLILVNVVAIGARHFFPAELLTHFRLHYLLATIAALLILLLAKRRHFLLPLAAVAIWNGSLLWPYIATSTPDDASGADLRVLHINVKTSNRNFADVVEIIQKEQPDVVVAQETDAGWIDALAALRNAYPYQHARPRADNFGMLVMSRIDGTRFSARALEAGDIPIISLVLPLAGEELAITALHTFPPMSPRLAAQRDAQLQEISSDVNSGGTHRLLVGDLNITPWSPPFRDLLEATGLNDTRKKFSHLATWPAVVGPLGIPIDHVLASDSLRITELQAFDSNGSDHRGLIAGIRLP